MEWSWVWVWVLVPVAGILAWGARGVTKAIVDGRRGATGPEELAAIRTRLDAIDGRLAVVEKAINDIP